MKNLQNSDTPFFKRKSLLNVEKPRNEDFVMHKCKVFQCKNLGIPKTLKLSPFHNIFKAIWNFTVLSLDSLKANPLLAILSFKHIRIDKNPQTRQFHMLIIYLPEMVQLHPHTKNASHNHEKSLSLPFLLIIFIYFLRRVIMELIAKHLLNEMCI